MIGEFFVGMLLSFLKPLFAMLPDIEWTVEFSSVATFVEIISAGAYFLPLGTVKFILFGIIAMTCVRIFISFVKLVTSLIPFVY